MYVCVCKAVTDSQIKSAIRDGACTRKQLFQCFGVGADCGKCNKHVRQLLDKSRGDGFIMPGRANPATLNAF